ncbi:MAG TPA: phosphatase PAP2 family protein [Candidatus Angelobacter sp.]|jgi:membrane-associated phospholipid phosphatase
MTHTFKYGFILTILYACTLCAPRVACAQATVQQLPESPAQANSALPDNPPPQSSGDEPEQRVVTWKTLPRDFLQDQKAIWLFPTQLARGRHWAPTLAVSGVTAGLIVADPHVMPYFRSHAGNLDDVNDVFDSYITTAEVAAIPAGLMVAGYARQDQYQVGTALLSGVAYADTAVVDLAIKAITRRERPSDVPPGQPFTNTFFNGGKSPFKGSSFPSGHAAGVFSVATVVATRYRKHRWVPWVMYGFAGAISFSRVTNSAHFPSDVFLGAALGYTITRYQVLRPRD